MLELLEDETLCSCVSGEEEEGKNQTMAASAEIEDFSDSFDQEFGFSACESTSVGSPAMEVERECAFPSTSGASSGIWYVDNGA